MHAMTDNPKTDNGEYAQEKYFPHFGLIRLICYQIIVGFHADNILWK